MGAPEKRDYERLKLDGNVSIKSADGRRRRFKAYLENISFGGFAMFAKSRRKMSPETMVEFELVTPCLDEYLPGKGKIRHITRPERYTYPFYIIGVQFTEVNKDMVTHLIKRLQARLVSAKIAAELRSKKIAKAIDYIPF